MQGKFEWMSKNSVKKTVRQYRSWRDNELYHGKGKRQEIIKNKRDGKLSRKNDQQSNGEIEDGKNHKKSRPKSKYKHIKELPRTNEKDKWSRRKSNPVKGCTRIY